MIVLEAKSRGRAAVVSDRGGLRSLVSDETGWQVDASSVEALSSTLQHVLSDSAQVASKGLAARADYEDRFTPTSHLRGLTATYEKAKRQ